jgi:GTP-binding protein
LIEASFVRSAAGTADLPRDAVAEIAMVGRSNVGKSSLINALLRQKIARTSAAPGKTRLANIYRVEAPSRFYLVDLPGYGYARAPRARERLRLAPSTTDGRQGPAAGRSQSADEFRALMDVYFGSGGRAVSALLLVDARHPGLPNDIEAWAWLQGLVAAQTIVAAKVVATKIDKLARGERIRAMQALESVHEHSVLPVSADTGEGLDELWTLINRWANSRTPKATAETRPTVPPTNPTARKKPQRKSSA